MQVKAASAGLTGRQTDIRRCWRLLLERQFYGCLSLGSFERRARIVGPKPDPYGVSFARQRFPRRCPPWRADQRPAVSRSPKARSANPAVVTTVRMLISSFSATARPSSSSTTALCSAPARDPSLYESCVHPRFGITMSLEGRSAPVAQDHRNVGPLRLRSPKMKPYGGCSVRPYRQIKCISNVSWLMAAAGARRAAAASGRRRGVRG